MYLPLWLAWVLVIFSNQHSRPSCSPFLLILLALPEADHYAVTAAASSAFWLVWLIGGTPLWEGLRERWVQGIASFPRSLLEVGSWRHHFWMLQLPSGCPLHTAILSAFTKVSPPLTPSLPPSSKYSNLKVISLPQWTENIKSTIKDFFNAEKLIHTICPVQ